MKKHMKKSDRTAFEFFFTGSLITLPVPFAPLFFGATSHFEDCSQMENQKDCVNHGTCGDSTNVSDCYNMSDCRGNANLNDCDNVIFCKGSSNPEGCYNAGYCLGSSNDGGNFIFCDNCINTGACPPTQASGPLSDLITGHGLFCL
jgi:hypothetical protein